MNVSLWNFFLLSFSVSLSLCVCLLPRPRVRVRACLCVCLTGLHKKKGTEGLQIGDDAVLRREVKVDDSALKTGRRSKLLKEAKRWMLCFNTKFTRALRDFSSPQLAVQPPCKAWRVGMGVERGGRGRDCLLAGELLLSRRFPPVLLSFYLVQPGAQH